MDHIQDFYKLLHVQPDAPEAVIKSSYRTLMQTLKGHPDLGGDEAHAKRLNIALATLLDPEKRARYDKNLHAKSMGAEFHTETTDADDLSQQAAHSADLGGHVDRQLCFFCHTVNVIAHQNGPWSSRQRCRVCQAPLTLHNAVNASGLAQQREVIRRETAIPATLQVTANNPTRHAVEVVDFSPNGTGIRSAQSFQEGECVYLRSDHFDAVGIITYSRKDSSGRNFSGRNASDQWFSGLKFLALEQHFHSGDLFSATY